MTRANMMKQINDMDLDEGIKPKKASDDDGDEDVNKPGSKAYLQRRQKQGEDDLKNAPSRSSGD